LIKNIIFDFDGVILDSVPVKTEAFRKLFDTFPKEKVDELIEYHLLNGGMSRYKKIEYFFNTLLSENITEQTVIEYAQKYSEITKEELSQKKYLIEDSLEFIKYNYQKYNLHIASGADENDLKYICKKLELEKYFLSINGSPKIKIEIVKDILLDSDYKKDETILIGDSINDFEAADASGIEFYGFNNEKLKENYNYIFKYEVLSNG
jgi:phosphoglycolate phosphatase-like HAD superfamily hydrolase